MWNASLPSIWMSQRICQSARGTQPTEEKVPRVEGGRRKMVMRQLVIVRVSICSSTPRSCSLPNDWHSDLNKNSIRGSSRGREGPVLLALRPFEGGGSGGRGLVLMNCYDRSRDPKDSPITNRKPLLGTQSPRALLGTSGFWACMNAPKTPLSHGPCLCLAMPSKVHGSSWRSRCPRASRRG
jgi:hypothetical protein